MRISDWSSDVCSSDLEGRSLDSVPAHKVIELGIAHVPEHRRLFPRLTVEENLRMGGFVSAARGAYQERLDFVYTLFPRMKERRPTLAGTLSGGEQPMFAMGRGLMSGPQPPGRCGQHDKR